MGKIHYYTWEQYSNNNFKYDAEYIRLYDAETNGYGIYLNRHKELVVEKDSLFTYHSKVEPIMDVVCIYQPEDYSVKRENVYSVFKMNDESVKVFTEKNEFAYLPRDWFYTSEQWFQKNHEEREAYMEKVKGILNSKVVEMERKNKEEKEAEKIKKEQEEKLQQELNLISAVSNAIGKNTSISKKVTETKIPRYVFGFYVGLSFILWLIGCLTQEYSLCVIGAIWIVCTFFLTRPPKDKTEELFEINVEYYDKIKAQNILPLDILGKMKLIENYIVIMRYKKIDEEIINLLQQSINMTVYFPTNDRYYEVNKEELNAKLNEFLDNTLAYVQQLLDDKEMEKIYIEKSMANDYLNMIDKNNELFKSIIKDKHHLTDIFKKQETNEEKDCEEEYSVSSSDDGTGTSSREM